MVRNKNKSSSRKSYDMPASAAHGVVMLLGAARDCATESCDDGLCVALIDQCISHLTVKYGLPENELDGHQGSAESSIGALVRLLRYVREELTDILCDERGGNLINQCIDHLLQAHVSDEQRTHDGDLQLVH